jgi:exosortase/archaeosortase family protein
MSTRPPTDRSTAKSWLQASIGAVCGIALGTVLLRRWHDVAVVEAWLNARLVSAIGLAETTSIGAAVIFPLEQRWVGFLVSTGCSVALLLVPPFVLAALLVGFRRVTLTRALVAVALAIGLLVVVNQIRLAAVVASMQLWGFEVGYQRSHVLIGSAISTVGLIAVAIVFFLLVGRGSRTRRSPGAR